MSKREQKSSRGASSHPGRQASLWRPPEPHYGRRGGGPRLIDLAGQRPMAPTELSRTYDAIKERGKSAYLGELWEELEAQRDGFVQYRGELGDLLSERAHAERCALEESELERLERAITEYMDSGDEIAAPVEQRSFREGGESPPPLSQEGVRRRPRGRRSARQDATSSALSSSDHVEERSRVPEESPAPEPECNPNDRERARGGEERARSGEERVRERALPKGEPRSDAREAERDPRGQHLSPSEPAQPPAAPRALEDWIRPLVTYEQRRLLQALCRCSSERFEGYLYELLLKLDCVQLEAIIRLSPGQLIFSGAREGEPLVALISQREPTRALLQRLLDQRSQRRATQALLLSPLPLDAEATRFAARFPNTLSCLTELPLAARCYQEKIGLSRAPLEIYQLAPSLLALLDEAGS